MISMKRMGVLLLASVPGLSLAADGAVLYRQHCAKCHGAEGRADTWRGYLYFARDLGNARWQAAQEDADLRAAIAEGPGMMPAYRDRLSSDDLTALVQHLRTLRRP